MTIEYGLVNRLKNDGTVAGIVAARIYPHRLPQMPTFPAITYSRVSGARVDILKGISGLAKPTFQFDLWTESYNTVKSLADAVRESLNGYQGTLDGETAYRVKILNEVDNFEEELGVYRVIQDFEVFHRET